MPLEAALLDAPPWDPLVAEAIDRGLDEAALDLKVTSIGHAARCAASSRAPKADG